MVENFSRLTSFFGTKLLFSLLRALRFLFHPSTTFRCDSTSVFSHALPNFSSS